MDTDKDNLNQITETIIGLAFKIHNTLGCGFAEKVYENALVCTGKRICLLLNFGKKVEVKRFVGPKTGN